MRGDPRGRALQLGPDTQNFLVHSLAQRQGSRCVLGSEQSKVVCSPGLLLVSARHTRQRPSSLQPGREAQASAPSFPPSQGRSVELLRVRQVLRKAVSQPQGSDTSHPSLQVG